MGNGEERIALVRYGAIPEVARCGFETDAPLSRGNVVVVQTHRGQQLGTFLEEVQAISRNGGADDGPLSSRLLRPATDMDRQQSETLRCEAEAEFPLWVERILRWNLKLELIDLEWTLDRNKLVLYVLNERGPECTKLALQAAAAGLGTIEVQPVGAEGLLQVATGGGCGSGGCGSGGCHS